PEESCGDHKESNAVDPQRLSLLACVVLFRVSHGSSAQRLGARCSHRNGRIAAGLSHETANNARLVAADQRAMKAGAAARSSRSLHRSRQSCLAQAGAPVTRTTTMMRNGNYEELIAGQ